MNGPKKGRQVRVSDRKPVTVGRDKGRLRLHDSRVSKHHAEIVFDNDAWILRDLGSSNGTYLNKRPLRGLAELEPGDVVQFGRIVVHVRQADAWGMREAETMDSGGAVAVAPAIPEAPPTPDQADGDEPLVATGPAVTDEDLDLDALFDAADQAEGIDTEEDEDDGPIELPPEHTALDDAPAALSAGDLEADDDGLSGAVLETEDRADADLAAIDDDDRDGDGSESSILIESGVFDPVPGASGWQADDAETDPIAQAEGDGPAEAEAVDAAAFDSPDTLEEPPAMVGSAQEELAQVEADAAVRETVDDAVDAVDEPVVVDADAVENPVDADATGVAIDEAVDEATDADVSEAEPESADDVEDEDEDVPVGSADQVRIDDDLPDAGKSLGTTHVLPNETLAAAAGGDRTAALSDESAVEPYEPEDAEEDAIGLAEDASSSVFDEAIDEPGVVGEQDAHAEHDYDLIRIGDDAPIAPPRDVEESQPADTAEPEGLPLAEEDAPEEFAEQVAEETAEPATAIAGQTPDDSHAIIDDDIEAEADDTDDQADEAIESAAPVAAQADGDADGDETPASTPHAIDAEDEDEPAKLGEEPAETATHPPALDAVAEETEAPADANGPVLAEALDAVADPAEEPLALPLHEATDAEPEADTDELLASRDAETDSDHETDADVDAPADAEPLRALAEPDLDDWLDDEPDNDGVIAADPAAPIAATPAEPQPFTEPEVEDEAEDTAQHADTQQPTSEVGEPEPILDAEFEQDEEPVVQTNEPALTGGYSDEVTEEDAVTAELDETGVSETDAEDDLFQIDDAFDEPEPNDPGATDFDAPAPSPLDLNPGTATAVARELDRDSDQEHAAILQAAAPPVIADDDTPPLRQTPGENPTTINPPQDPRSSYRSGPVARDTGSLIKRLAVAAVVFLVLGTGVGLYLGIIDADAVVGRFSRTVPDNPGPRNLPGDPPDPNLGDPRTGPNNPDPGPIGNNPDSTPPAEFPAGTARTPDPFANNARVIGADALPSQTTRGPRTDPGTAGLPPGVVPIPPLVLPNNGGPNTPNVTDPNTGTGTTDTPRVGTGDNNPNDPIDPATPVAGERLVFLVDCSGSLVDTLPQMLLWLREAIDTLGPGETFTIIFFKKDQAIETLPAGLQPLTRAYQRRLNTDWLDPDASPVFTSGRSDPSAAIELALSYNPSDIYLLSDESFAKLAGDTTPQQATDLVANALGSTDIRLHGVQFFYDSGDSSLQALAEQFNGTYEFVAETRHPDQDPIDLLEELENRNE